jgi:hypothetical protein
MAYSISETSAMQTAVKAASDIVVALVNTAQLESEHIKDTMDEYVQFVYTSFLAPALERDRQAAPDTTITTSRPFGGRRDGGHQKEAITPDDAENTVINFGAFKGLTLGAVSRMTASEAREYTDGKYTRTGQSYLKWLLNDTEPARAFIRARAKVVLDNMQQG